MTVVITIDAGGTLLFAECCRSTTRFVGDEEQLVEYAAELDARLGDCEAFYDGVRSTPGACVIAIAEGPMLFKARPPTPLLALPRHSDAVHRAQALSRGFHTWASAARGLALQRLWEATPNPQPPNPPTGAIAVPLPPLHV